MVCKDLRAAASELDVQCLRELLKGGADPNTRYEQGVTPLHYVAVNCWGNLFTYHCVETAKALLEKRADPNARDGWGMTPLHYAASGGNSKLVKLLLDYGADPNATDKFRRTPLHMAVLNEFVNPDVVRLLLERGADPAIADVYGRTPIDYATRFGRNDIAQILAGRTSRHAVPQQQERRKNLFEKLLRKAKPPAA